MSGARDGQLRTHRGTDSPPWALQMFDDELGLWLTLAQANVEDDLMLAGVPILRGPYIVDFNQIPHDGNARTLWTPEVGDVLLRLFADPAGATFWDSGHLFIGQNVDGTATPPVSFFAYSHNSSDLGTGAVTLGDNVLSVVEQNSADATGQLLWSTAQVFHSADPVQIQLAQTGGIDPTQGHVELYALVARAVAP